MRSEKDEESWERSTAKATREKQDGEGKRYQGEIAKREKGNNPDCWGEESSANGTRERQPVGQGAETEESRNRLEARDTAQTPDAVELDKSMRQKCATKTQKELAAAPQTPPRKGQFWQGSASLDEESLRLPLSRRTRSGAERNCREAAGTVELGVSHESWDSSIYDSDARAFLPVAKLVEHVGDVIRGCKLHGGTGGEAVLALRAPAPTHLAQSEEGASPGAVSCAVQ